MSVFMASIDALPTWALSLVLIVVLLIVAIVLGAVTGALGEVVDNSFFSGEEGEE